MRSGCAMVGLGWSKGVEQPSAVLYRDFTNVQQNDRKWLRVARVCSYSNCKVQPNIRAPPRSLILADDGLESGGRRELAAENWAWLARQLTHSQVKGRKDRRSIGHDQAWGIVAGRWWWGRRRKGELQYIEDERNSRD